MAGAVQLELVDDAEHHGLECGWVARMVNHKRSVFFLVSKWALRQGLWGIRHILLQPHAFAARAAAALAQHDLGTGARGRPAF